MYEGKQTDFFCQITGVIVSLFKHLRVSGIFGQGILRCVTYISQDC
jgi:hypothetical protein